MNGQPRKLIESREYTEEFAKLGDAQILDEALLSLTWGIAKNAEDFDIVPGLAPIRVAKTDAVNWESKSIPRLLIFFRIASTHVDLLWVEKVEE